MQKVALSTLPYSIEKKQDVEPSEQEVLVESDATDSGSDISSDLAVSTTTENVGLEAVEITSVVGSMPDADADVSPVFGEDFIQKVDLKEGRIKGKEIPDTPGLTPKALDLELASTRTPGTTRQASPGSLMRSAQPKGQREKRSHRVM